MFLNNDRKTVEDIDQDDTLSPADRMAKLYSSLCPSCVGELSPVRPKAKRWHWRHKTARPPTCTASYESAWHLDVKAAAKSDGYEIEYPFGDWRFDAFSDHKEFIVVEAVNSFSKRYYDKSDALAEIGPRALWILNDVIASGPKFADLRYALRKANATIWIVDCDGVRGDRLTRLAALIDVEVNGVFLDDALVKVADRQLMNIEAKRQRIIEQRLAAVRRAETEKELARQREIEAKEQVEADRKRAAKTKWANRQPFSETVDFVREKLKAEGDVAVFVAWMMIFSKNQTRVGMPDDPPPLTIDEQHTVIRKYRKYAAEDFTRQYPVFQLLYPY